MPTINFSHVDACRTWYCWFDQHEGLGVWFGSLASIVVAVTAVSVVFLQKFLTDAGERQAEAIKSLGAATQVMSALKIIDELEGDLTDRVGIPPERENSRPWRSEFISYVLLMRALLENPYWDPEISQFLAQTHALVDAILPMLTTQTGFLELQGNVPKLWYPT